MGDREYRYGWIWRVDFWCGLGWVGVVVVGGSGGSGWWVETREGGEYFE